MGKIVGFWDTNNTQLFDCTLITHEDYEYYDQIFLAENSVQELVKDFKILKLKQSVQRNPEIFAWYFGISELFELDLKISDSSSGYLVCLIKEFFQSFKELNSVACSRLLEDFERIDFQNYYMYRTKWLLGELFIFIDLFRKAFIESSPMSMSDDQEHKIWWQQPLIIQTHLDNIKNKCDFNGLRGINELKLFFDSYEQLIIGLKKWAGLRNLNQLEATSGYFLALAGYWIDIGNYQLTLLYCHRSVENALLLLGFRQGLVIATASGLRHGNGDLAGLDSTLKCLIQNGQVIFSRPEEEFLIKLNRFRNTLREVHGFRVITKLDAAYFLALSERFIANLRPDIKSYAYRNRFKIDLNLPLKLIFDAESDIESYFDIIKTF